MEHWAQRCDGSGVDPAEHAAVCKERDRLKAELQSVIAKLHETESERDGLKVALDGAKLSMKALNEKLVEVAKYTCSACGEYRLSATTLSQATNYCPNCGAHMKDGE